VTRLAGNTSGSQGSCALTGDPTTVSYFSGYTEGTAVDTSGRAYLSIRADTDAMNRACVIRVSGSVAAQAAGQNGTGTTGDNGPAIGATMTAPAAFGVHLQRRPVHRRLQPDPPRDHPLTQVVRDGPPEASSFRYHGR
jgi:hypothetical protein